jgi:Fe-S-cluster containining protein
VYETDLARIKLLAGQKQAEYEQFRADLRHGIVSADELDAIVRRLWGVVSSRINCRECANCCRELAAAIEQKDVVRLARAEGITPEAFELEFLEKTSERGRFLIRKKPCPFLDHKLCRHYDSRPDSCEEYPFLHTPDFLTRSRMLLWNLPCCPIVYNVFEMLRAEIAELELLRRAARQEDTE